jgi:uncharacterized linocin/CFP29 family protein
MSNLGRDKLWTPEVWAEIDKAVMAEVGRLRVAQKVFASTTAPGAANVSTDPFAIQAGVRRIAEGQTVPFLEIFGEFALTRSQVDNEATLRTGRTLAQLAARSVALMEDLLFFQGQGVALLPGTQVVNQASAGNGLLGLAAVLAGNPIAPLPPAQRREGLIWGSNTFDGVTRGIGQLIAAGQPGPFALVLATNVYADIHATTGNTTNTADRISPLVEGRLFGTGTIPDNQGLLVSLGGNTTTIHVAQDCITAYTQEDEQGNYRFRVFERVQIVSREPQAFVRLPFQAP